MFGASTWGFGTYRLVEQPRHMLACVKCTDYPEHSLLTNTIKEVDDDSD